MIRHRECRIKNNVKIMSRLRWSNSDIRREESEILDSWAGRPIRRNSVLDRLSERRFVDIHWETRLIVFCRCRKLAENSGAQMEMKNWVSSAKRWWPIDKSEIRELTGVVKSMNKRGPRIDPCGTPWQRGEWAEEVELIETTKLQDDE